MNSSRNNSNNNCLSCLSCIVLLAGIIVLIIDFTQIATYNNLQNQIDSYSYNQYYHSCYQVCGWYYYYERNGLCCQYYDYTYCTSKSGCISNLIYQLQLQKDSVGSQITTLSIIAGVLMLIFVCCMCKCCGQKTRHPNQAPLLIHQNSGNINRSQGTAQQGKRIDVGYESFAYVDQQNTCCICLEEFNNEKAILLKCGHIFHSGCIRDWSVKQENCPVCRSSQ